MVVLIYLRSTKLEDGVHLLGAFSDLEVPETVAQCIKDWTGDLTLGRCQSFKRALIHGEVFHSKSYGRVSRRNSYTVTYEDNQKKTECGQIQYFLKHTPICQRGCIAFCKCNRDQHFAIVVHMGPLRDSNLIGKAGIEGIQKQLQIMQKPRYMNNSNVLSVV